MNLSGVHVLLTYTCTFECDHCFVWGSPWQEGTLTLRRIEEILRQAADLETVEWVYFEGGEPFLFYPILVSVARSADRRGFRVGTVTNAYWAIDVDDAVEWLRPLAGIVRDLSISRDDFHGGADHHRFADHARTAALRLGIPAETITIARPACPDARPTVGHIPPGESAVMYRGRAAARLAVDAPQKPWERLASCPFEDLRDPERIHVDPLGYVHVCQGIAIGNVFETPLAEICRTYDPDADPIVGPLLRGGPAELVRQHALPHRDRYADACHLCDEARRTLRERYPDRLAPDQMYRVVGAD